MLRHALAPLLPVAAASLRLPRTLPELDPARAQTGAVAITFDDGPHPEGTPAILEILARHGARATFFVIGEQVERRPELVRETEAAGHAVALHGHLHRLQLRRATPAMRDDVARGVALLGETLGHAPILHRAPYGIYSPAGLAAAREHGLHPLLWSCWGRDWRRHITPQGIARRVTRRLSAGDIILLHDADFYSAEGSHRRTARALELILAELDSRGLDTVLPV